MAAEALLRTCFFVAFLAFQLGTLAAEAIDYPPGCPSTYSRALGPLKSDFPEGFVFGAATSATQVEGAAAGDGRSPSIWDVSSLTPGFIKDGTTPTVTVDQYHKFQEDVQLLSVAGFKSYRLSISWSRILPDGRGAINQAGIDYYNDLINALLSAGIEPAVTLYHWDLPQALENEYGGWLSANVANDFANYADICFKAFGDRVKTWITLNEPAEVAVQGYGTGGFAPGRCSNRSTCPAGDSRTEPYLAGNNQLLAHAAASSVYRQQYQEAQGGKIGISLDSQFLYPSDNEPANVAAAERGMEFSYGWFADPIHFGDYPAALRTYAGDRLPQFTEAESKMLKGSVDFYGINFYTASYAWEGEPSSIGLPWSDSQVMTSQVHPTTGALIGAETASPWLKVVPTGIRGMLNWIADRYNNTPIYVTENGSSDVNDPSIPLNVALCDTQRVGYYQSYLSNVVLAIRDGANVQAYYAWSLLDNWEWAQGFTQRFGIVFVNFTDPGLPRSPKASASWFRDFLGAAPGAAV